MCGVYAAGGVASVALRLALVLVAGCYGCDQPEECNWAGDEAVGAELLSEAHRVVERDGEAPDMFVVRDEEEFREVWSRSGAEGDRPEVDFAERQVVVLNTWVTGCPHFWEPRGVRKVVGDPERLLVLTWFDQCGQCDTGRHYNALWSTPIREVTLCEDWSACPRDETGTWP